MTLRRSTEPTNTWGHGRASFLTRWNPSGDGKASQHRTHRGSWGFLSQTFIRGAFIVCSPSMLTQDEEGERMISFKGAHFPQDIILMGVRWYVAYPLSYRHVEELM